MRLRIARRTPRTALSAGSYGLAILLIAATYVLATLPARRWTVPLLLLVQVGTVWYALRTSGVRLGVRRCATVVFGVALVAGAWNVVHPAGGLVGCTFL